MDLQQQLGEWYPLLSHVFATDWMRKLGRRLGAAENVVPQKEHGFRAFQLCPPQKLKVVIIGQDPYINGEADGLAFSSFGKMTPSLEVVFAEINRTHDCKRKQTHLDDWAEQGLLLLNAVLTTRMGKSREHKDWGWEHFLQEVLTAIHKHLDQPIVFMAWGNDAYNSIIRVKHKGFKVFPWRILKAYHPQAQNYNPTNKFVGCNHFIEANLHLMKNDRWPIWWSDPELLAVEENYKNYCYKLLKQIPDAKTHFLKELHSNPSISINRHPFDDRLGPDFTDDLPF